MANPSGKLATTASRTGPGGPAVYGPAFDVLRILATFFVLMYHASLAYLSRPMRLTLWHVYDAHHHVGMDVFAYWVNSFAMPLFFLAAGLIAPAGVESRGVRVFLKHRAGRLLRPLLFASIAIVPVCYLLTAYGLLTTGRTTPDEILSWRFRPEVRTHLYGLGHLWFLEYLFLVCVLWSGCWWLGRKLRRRSGAEASSSTAPGLLERTFASSWCPVLLAVPTAAIFLIDTDTILRVENNVVPNPSRVLHYLYFFAVGGWLAYAPSARDRLVKSGRLYLGLAALTFVVMLPGLLRLASSPLTGVDRIGVALLGAVLPWLTILGALGVALGRPGSKSSTTRFLAEASFWVYLIHLPIVMFAQIVLCPLGWPGVVKFLVVSAVAIALSVASYEAIVRYSLVGEIVNGARKRLKGPRRVSPEFGWAATAFALVVAAGSSVWYLHVFIWKDNYHAVPPTGLYRSAVLTRGELDRALTRDGIRSVIALTDGRAHTSIARQRALCEARGVAYHEVGLPENRRPDAATLVGLADLIATTPRPILAQGERGLDPAAFASALALLLDGQAPEVALGQFDLRYAQFGGAEHSVLGSTLVDYTNWLRRTNAGPTPERFRAWAALQQADQDDRAAASLAREVASPSQTR
jgi:peptidoglycan/LPS O-acetylase OafA/YrhL